MKLDTNSGLHGTVLAYQQTGVTAQGAPYGIALVDRGEDHAPKRYSTHELVFFPDGTVTAFYGHYDLSRGDAGLDFHNRVQR